MGGSERKDITEVRLCMAGFTYAARIHPSN
jgi:hypothetical protein